MELANYILSFDPHEHKYTDNVGTEYTSVTTKISEYHDHFDIKAVARACEKIGRNAEHPKYLKYRGKNRHQLAKEWEITKKVACARGNKKHNFLEDSVNASNGYRKIIKSKLKKGRIYTILDILNEPKLGEVNLEFFIKTGIQIKYPEIFELIAAFVNNGYKIFSEVCVFCPEYGIAGLIDILAIKDGHFVIIDWKTNRDDIRAESGYFDKDAQGNRTGEFIRDHKTFGFPLQHIPASVKSKYTFQLSMYDYLVELTGLKQQANILCHIRHETYTEYDKKVLANPELLGREKVDIMPIEYWHKDTIAMLDDGKKYIKLKEGVNLFSPQDKIRVL